MRFSRFAFALSVAALGCGPSGDLARAPLTRATPATNTPSAPPPLASGRLPGTARPLHYGISLIIDPSKDRFVGDVIIDVDVPATTRAIVLHGRDLTIVRAEAMAGGEHVPAEVEARMSSGGKDTPEELVLSLGRPIPAGKAQIRIAYSGPLNESLVAAGALGAFTDPALLKQGLDLLLTDRIKVQDGFFIWSLANSWAETRPITIQWVKERWPELKRKIPAFLLARFAEAIASICDGATRADAAAFFGEGLKDIEGADRRLHQLLETADLCIDLRAREGSSAKKRLLGK